MSELRGILVATGASDGRMQEGSIRIDANVSVRPVGSDELGTRCEVKNLNSLRSLVRAIEYEAERQADLARLRCFGHPGDPPLGRDRRPHPLAPLEGRGLRLPVLPRARPRAGGPRRCPARGGPGERRASCRPPGGSASPRSPAPTRSPTRSRPSSPSTSTSSSWRRPASGPTPPSPSTRAANDAAAKADAARALEPSAFAALVRLESAGTLSATQSKAVLAELLDGDGEADPEEIARRLGFEALEDLGARGGRRRRHRRSPGRVGPVCRG